MAIVGFNFNKIDVQKKNVPSGKIQITNNIGLKDVQKTEMALGTTKQTGLKFLYSYRTEYSNNVGHIAIEGELLFLLDKSKTDEILKMWEKSKKVPAETMQTIMSTVVNKCTVEAVLFAKETGLPSPIPMPKVGINQAETPTKKSALKSKK